MFVSLFGVGKVVVCLLVGIKYVSSLDDNTLLLSQSGLLTSIVGSGSSNSSLINTVYMTIGSLYTDTTNVIP